MCNLGVSRKINKPIGAQPMMFKIMNELSKNHFHTKD